MNKNLYIKNFIQTRKKVYSNNNQKDNYKNVNINNQIYNVNAKYAVMVASTVNLGDDIQTLAAINYLKKKGITEYIFIDREKLSDYNNQPVTLIMNGWFMHNLSKFPPSNKITPIFISMHVNNEKLIENNISYFKKYEPIGCRDEYTVNLFKKNNIDAYFTGCLTLYFDEHNIKENKKYLVDINTCSYIPNININLKKYIEFEKIKHDGTNQDLLNNIGKRLKAAEDLLNKYRSAKLVITTRLHCILPCRAFNTNAIFIHANYNTDSRFKGLEKYINGDIVDHDKNNIDRDIIKKIHIFFDNYNII
jgi:hypothetical protein